MSGRNLWTYFINITLIAQAIVPDEEVRSTSLKFGQRPRQRNRKCFAVINLVVSTILLLLLLLNLNLMMLKRSQKALCPASLFCFSFSPSPFPHVPAQSCREPLWVFRPAMAAMGRENNCCRQALGRVRKAPTIFHNAQVGFWIAKGRLQHVTVTLFKFKSTVFSS